MSVNAFYSPNSNTMIVPIGMLQDPLYWSQPKSLTFGAFGIVVGKKRGKIYTLSLARFGLIGDLDLWIFISEKGEDLDFGHWPGGHFWFD